MSFPAEDPPYLTTDEMAEIETLTNCEGLEASRPLSPYIPQYLAQSLRGGESPGMPLEEDFAAYGMQAFLNHECPAANESFPFPTREGSAASQPRDSYNPRGIRRHWREDRPCSPFDLTDFGAQLRDSFPVANPEVLLANESSSLPTRERPTASQPQNSNMPRYFFQFLGGDRGQRVFTPQGSEVLEPGPPVHEPPADLEPCSSARESLIRKRPRSFRLTLTIILHMFYLEGKSAQEITDHFQSQGTSLSKIFVENVTGAAVPSVSTMELMVRFEQAIKRTDEQLETLKAWFEDKWGGEN